MSTTSPSTIRETGCAGIELTWDSETADRARQLVIDATGSDCFHEPGASCFLVDVWQQTQVCLVDRYCTPERAQGVHDLWSDLTGKTCDGPGRCDAGTFLAATFEATRARNA